MGLTIYISTTSKVQKDRKNWIPAWHLSCLDENGSCSTSNRRLWTSYCCVPFWFSALKYILLHWIIVLFSDTSKINGSEASLTSDIRAVLQKTVLPNESKWLLGAHLHLAKWKQGVGARCTYCGSWKWYQSIKISVIKRSN